MTCPYCYSVEGVWTDDPLLTPNNPYPEVRGIVIIRDQHIKELQVAVNAMESKFGVTQSAWSDTAPIRGQNIIELRQAIEAILSRLGVSLSTYLSKKPDGSFLDPIQEDWIDPDLSSVGLVRAIHIEQLRKTIEQLTWIETWAGAAKADLVEVSGNDYFKQQFHGGTVQGDHLWFYSSYGRYLYYDESAGGYYSADYFADPAYMVYFNFIHPGVLPAYGTPVVAVLNAETGLYELTLPSGYKVTYNPGTNWYLSDPASNQFHLWETYPNGWYYVKMIDPITSAVSYWVKERVVGRVYTTDADWIQLPEDPTAHDWYWYYTDGYTHDQLAYSETDMTRLYWSTSYYLKEPADFNWYSYWQTIMYGGSTYGFGGGGVSATINAYTGASFGHSISKFEIAGLYSWFGLSEGGYTGPYAAQNANSSSTIFVPAKNIYIAPNGFPSDAPHIYNGATIQFEGCSYVATRESIIDREASPGDYEYVVPPNYWTPNPPMPDYPTVEISIVFIKWYNGYVAYLNTGYKLSVVPDSTSPLSWNQITHSQFNGGFTRDVWQDLISSGTSPQTTMGFVGVVIATHVRAGSQSSFYSQYAYHQICSLSLQVGTITFK